MGSVRAEFPTGPHKLVLFLLQGSASEPLPMSNLYIEVAMSHHQADAEAHCIIEFVHIGRMDTLEL